MTFEALGQPSRLRIVELLRDAPCAVAEVVEALDLRQPQVSKHLKVLSEAGLVAAEPQGKQRIYHLEAAPFEALGHWVDSFERAWDARLDALGRFIASSTTPSPPPARRTR